VKISFIFWMTLTLILIRSRFALLADIFPFFFHGGDRFVPPEGDLFSYFILVSFFFFNE
jgi:hypothetical protein